jgi:hypothetical protein
LFWQFGPAEIELNPDLRSGNVGPAGRYVGGAMTKSKTAFLTQERRKSSTGVPSLRYRTAKSNLRRFL